MFLRIAHYHFRAGFLFIYLFYVNVGPWNGASWQSLRPQSKILLAPYAQIPSQLIQVRRKQSNLKKLPVPVVSYAVPVIPIRI